jgi:hypothetical protein
MSNTRTPNNGGIHISARVGYIPPQSLIRLFYYAISATEDIQTCNQMGYFKMSIKMNMGRYFVKVVKMLIYRSIGIND